MIFESTFGATLAHMHVLIAIFRFHQCIFVRLPTICITFDSGIHQVPNFVHIFRTLLSIIIYFHFLVNELVGQSSTVFKMTFETALVDTGYRYITMKLFIWFFLKTRFGWVDFILITPQYHRYHYKNLILYHQTIALLSGTKLKCIFMYICISHLLHIFDCEYLWPDFLPLQNTTTFQTLPESYLN